LIPEKIRVYPRKSAPKSVRKKNALFLTNSALVFKSSGQFMVMPGTFYDNPLCNVQPVSTYNALYALHFLLSLSMCGFLLTQLHL